MISKEYLDAVKEIIKLNPERHIALNSDVDSILFIDGNMADFNLPGNCKYDGDKLVVNDQAYEIKNIKEMDEDELITGKNLEDMLSLSDNILGAVINDKNAKVEFTDAPVKASSQSLAKRIKLIPEDFKRFVEKNNFIKGLYDNKIRAKNKYDRALKEYEFEKGTFAVDFDDLKNRVNAGNLSLDEARGELQFLLESLSKAQASLTAMNIARAYYNEGSGKIKGLAIPKEGILGKRFNWYRHDLRNEAIQKADKLFMDYANALINFKDKDDTKFLDRVEANMKAFDMAPSVISDKIINGDDEISLEDIKKEMAPKEEAPIKEEIKEAIKPEIKEDKKLSDYVFNILKLCNKYDDLTGNDDPLIMAKKANVREQITRAVKEYLVEGRHINIDEWVNLDDISLDIARDIAKQTLENKRILEEKGLTVKGSDTGKLYHFNNGELDKDKRLKLFEAYPNLPYPSYAAENLNRWEKAAKYVEPEKTIEEQRHETLLNLIEDKVEERVNYKLNLEKDNIRRADLDIQINSSVDNLDKIRKQIALYKEFQKNSNYPHAFDDSIKGKEQELANEYQRLDVLCKERTAKYVVENGIKRLVSYSEVEAKEAELAKTEAESYKFFINEGRNRRGEDGFKKPLVEGDKELDVSMLAYPDLARIGSLYIARDFKELNDELDNLESMDILNKECKARKKELTSELNKLQKINDLEYEIKEMKEAANKPLEEAISRYKEESRDAFKNLYDRRKAELKDMIDSRNDERSEDAFNKYQEEERKDFEKAKAMKRDAFEDELINDKMLRFAFVEISRDEEANIDNKYIKNKRKDDIILGRNKDNKVVFDYNGNIAKEKVLADFREYYDTKYGVDREVAEEFARGLKDPAKKEAYMASYNEYQNIKNEAKNKADQIYAHIINK